MPKHILPDTALAAAGESTKDGFTEEGPDSKRHKLIDEGDPNLPHTNLSIRSSYTCVEMDGNKIPQSFSQLETYITIAADSLSDGLNAEVPFRLNLDQYGSDDVEFLQTIPIDNLIQSLQNKAPFYIARMFIGWFLYRWIFRTPFMGYDVYKKLIKEAITQVCNTKMQLEPQKVDLSPRALKDSYYLLTTQSSVLEAVLLERSTELAGRAVTILGTLFKAKVPRCAVVHQSEQMLGIDCNLWSCQVRAIVHSAFDLSIKLEQRSFETVFQWPIFGEEFDKSLMENDSREVHVDGFQRIVNMVFMPAVIDRHDSENPSAVGGGVWYKAMVSLQDCG